LLAIDALDHAINSATHLKHGQEQAATHLAFLKNCLKCDEFRIQFVCFSTVYFDFIPFMIFVY